VTKAEWQRIAEERVHDSAALLSTRRWSAAYYLAGYAVECGLKACVLRKTKLKAEKLYQAIIDTSNGVLPWIRNHW